jgi:hypothetical protein
MTEPSQAARQRVITRVTEIVTDIVNNDYGIPLVVGITPTGPKLYGALPPHIALHLLKSIVDQVNWATVEDPPADWLAALGQLQ